MTQHLLFDMMQKQDMIEQLCYENRDMDRFNSYNMTTTIQHDAIQKIRLEYNSQDTEQ